MSLVLTSSKILSAEAESKVSLSRLLRPLLGLVLPVGLAVLWELAVGFGWSNGRLVPPPSVILATFAELWGSGELQTHALATLTRVAAGFVCGVLAGTIAGAITGYSSLSYRLADPTLQALRSIPSRSSWDIAPALHAPTASKTLTIVRSSCFQRPALIVPP